MKKILILLILVCMMAIPIIAAPQPPYILYGHVEWNNQLLYGSKLDITIKGVTETVTTDSEGYWVHQLSTYSNDDSIEIKVRDGCGTGDTCSKTVVIGSPGYEDYAKIDFSITGTLTCPPISCNCGGCGGGGSGCYYSKTVCNDKYPPEECKSCSIPEYTKTLCNSLFPCEETTIPDCEEIIPCPEEECPDVPEGITGGQILIWIISLIGVGGLGSFVGIKLTGDRISRVKGVTYRIAVERDGDVRKEHRHAGIRSYHSINTVHREAHERHPKGMEFPLYEKDINGVYNYIPVKG